MTELILDKLIENGVLDPRSPDELQLHGDFVEDVQYWYDATTNGEGDATPQLSSEAEELLAGVIDSDPEFVGKYLALRDRTEGMPLERQVHTVFVLDQFVEPRLQTDGVPEAFLPIRGTHLQTAVELYRRVVVYGWRDDCDPCDAMKRHFDDIFESSPDDVALFAVYGPEYASLLHRQYDMEGAPTTLFFLDGSVDVRLTGGKHRQAIESEVEMLRERSVQSRQ